MIQKEKKSYAKEVIKSNSITEKWKVKSSIISEWLWLINLIEYYARVINIDYLTIWRLWKHTGKTEDNYIIIINMNAEIDCKI